MNIEEIKRMKEQAEAEILSVLESLECATKLDISKVTINNIDVSTITNTSIKISSVKIELIL